MKFFITFIIFLIILISNIPYTIQEQYYPPTDGYRITIYGKIICPKSENKNEKVDFELKYKNEGFYKQGMSCNKNINNNHKDMLISHVSIVDKLEKLKDINVTFTYQSNRAKFVSKNIENDCENDSDETKKYKVYNYPKKVIECRFKNITIV